MTCPKCGANASKIANKQAFFCLPCDTEMPVTAPNSTSLPSHSPKTNKYGVAPKDERTTDGIVFDSKKEMNRYSELKLLEKAGKISDLKRQVKFEISVGTPPIHICDYFADFVYMENGWIVIEDSKGVRTPEYKLKKKLVEAIYGFKIKET